MSPIVVWIKEYRSVWGCSLKDAKEAWDSHRNMRQGPGDESTQDRILRLSAEIGSLVRQRDELLTALNDVATRIKDHPAYEELTEDEEMSIGGDTAELSYLARICDSAMSCVEQSAESETQASLTRADETQTSIPAIVFYPAGSLGEAVEEGA